MSFPPDDPPLAIGEHARLPDDQDREAKLHDLDAAIARGLADAEAGRVKPIHEAFARIRARLGMTDLQQNEIQKL